MNLFIDSDVLIDIFTTRKPFYEYSNKVILKSIELNYSLFTSSLAIANIYYLLSKVANHDFAIEKLFELVKIVELLGVEKKEIMAALESNFKDFEDAIQYYSAEHFGIDSIITRNTKDYDLSKIQVITPKEFLNNHKL